MSIIRAVLYHCYWKRRIDKFIENMKEKNPDIEEWSVWYGWNGLKPIVVINMNIFQL